MRKCKYFKWEKGSVKVLAGEAIFHKWGVDFEEFDNGAVNISTAIIELPDGTVKNISCEMIQFYSPDAGG